MKDFFPIETPYDSEDYKLMKNVVNKGIDSHLEGFTKSEFKKSPHFNNKFLFDIHTSELPILYRRLQELADETGNDDYISFLNDIQDVAKDSFDDTIEQELHAENSSDSLANLHGMNAKPNTIEEDSIMRRKLAGQRGKTVPLGQHAPHSQAAKK